MLEFRQEKVHLVWLTADLEAFVCVKHFGAHVYTFGHWFGSCSGNPLDAIYRFYLEENI